MSDERFQQALKRRLPELLELQNLAVACQDVAKVRVEAEVSHAGQTFPLYSFSLGSRDPAAPVVAFVGGVHGLERIGTNVVISFLKTLLELVQWDKGLQHLLAKARISFLPLVNPGGMYSGWRCNPGGIDLMRNAPLDAEVTPNIMLVGGHRLSRWLPWYRGALGAPMQQEATALLRFARREIFGAKFAIALDLHSGFGMVDRLWFPYAYSKRPFDHIDKMFALKTRLDRSLPNHFYLMEPQSLKYVTHGDLWDYLYLEHRAKHPGQVFLPMTLEMGSWLWIKKNPRQALSSLGIFNPVLPHRIQRTLRRHLALLDFLFRAVVSHENWLTGEILRASNCEQKARELWRVASSA